MFIDIKPQSDFPYLKQYKEKFPIDKSIIFPYGNTLYSDVNVPPDIMAHELKHFEQQKEIGLEYWEIKYLNDPEFRLKVEIEAFRTQVAFHKDKELKELSRQLCAEALSSPMYGGIISYRKAYSMLNV